MSNHKHFGEGAIRKWHHPEISLESIGLRSGMTFMDVGCGYGFFTIPAAQIVGEKGKVYAVDINASAIDQLKREAAEKGLKNIRADVGEAEETVFCDACADIVFYSTVLHDFREPAKVLHNAKKMIKPDGTLVNLDWKKKPMPFGPPVQIRFSEEQASNLIKQAGFTIESVKDVGDDFYIVTAKPQSSSYTGKH
ncbi:class I SAM-dependent methyltransferase [Candidatus Bathyarchaeota archaeon]|nr:class I SAM-dependent methyltransferase [Candidatus Bathyarchaeota archaeon]